MAGKSKKVLTNVWVNLKDNQLYCSDIYFTDTISEIRPRDMKVFEYAEIRERQSGKGIYNKKGKNDFVSGNAVFDGDFNLIIPGAIDAHVHFNTPGFEGREDFEHGSRAAAFGGVTTVLDMPCTSIPSITSEDSFIYKKNILQGRSYIDYAFWGGIKGNDFDNDIDVRNQIELLADAGVVGFKAYQISGMETFSDLNTEQLTQVAQWVKKTELPLAVHSEDKERIVKKRTLLQKQGKNTWRDYCDARDMIAELEAVIRMKLIADKTGCKIHIVHLSSSVALGIVRQAQKAGLSFSAETCPHYLYFTQNDFESPAIASFLKTAPPVKFYYDRKDLWNGLKDGTLEFVTTDHAGCDPKVEKFSTNFWEVYGGIPGVEHRVPFMMSEGFKKGRLTLEQTIKLISTNPALYYKLLEKGRLKERYDADFTLIDLWKNQKISSGKMHSKGKYTPFEGVQFNAAVVGTFLRGEPVMLNSNLIKPDKKNGKLISPDRNVVYPIS